MNGSNNINTATSKGQKNKKRHFNFVDLTLVIVAVLLLCGIVYLVSPISIVKNWISNDTKTIIYEVEFTNVDEKFIENIAVDNTAIDGVSKNTLGKVVSVDHNTNYSELGIDPNNVDYSKEMEGIKVEYPNRYNVRVRIETEANFAEGKGYTVNSTRIAVGEKLSLKFPNFVGDCYCVDIIEY